MDAAPLHPSPQPSAREGQSPSHALRDFAAVQDFLDELGLFHSDFALCRMEKALAALGLDQHLPFAVVQIVGTNGKGSTATFLAALAQSHGVRTGLYTSPHFVTPRERVRIDGVMLEAESWPPLARKVHAAAPDLTYFEFLTVLALLAFAEDGVQLVVLEAGLGGHYDATTAVPAELVCFTPIDLDHEKVLGDTVTAVASDKAYAARPGCLMLSGPQPPEALAVLQQRARDLDLSLLNADAGLPADLRLGLEGPHQKDNARLALTAWTRLARLHNWPVREQAVREGLSTARIAGRFQRAPLRAPASPDPVPLILDGGHNAHGLKALAQALREADLHPRALIFACLGDKNLSAMLPLVLDMAGTAPIYTPTIHDNERALDGTALAAALGPPQALPMPRLHSALAAARQTSPPPGVDPSSAPVVVCGSLYLLGEFFTLCPHWLE